MSRDAAGGPPDSWGMTADQRALLLDPDRHLQALSRIATEALLAGAWDTAFAFADRLCRLSSRAQARGLLLRAEAARRLGDGALARDDIRRALEHDPTDRLVNLHALQLTRGESRLGAARAIVDDVGAPTPAVLSALAALHGDRVQIVCRIEATDADLRGWVTWPPGGPLDCAIVGAGLVERCSLAADPAHPLASERWQAADFTHPRPDLGQAEVRFSCEGGATHREVFPSRAPPRPDSRSPHFDPSEEAVDLTVIVPVFEDAAATRVCLDSLEAQALPGRRWCTIVVDDASPNPELVADVARRARDGRLTLLTNGTNLGFAASVNRAAALTGAGDLLLLNADTVLPEAGLARLVALAAATPGVGTITPVSNNGVITSFPAPYVSNPLPAMDELAAWDRAARTADPPPIDLPNGIGFCLLITRACWTAVGGMPLSYGQGYYEDVEFCLTARQHGYRNLCAANLVVGHAGSVSFGARKRRLVVRNAAALDLRYPDYRAEIEAFRSLDPLRPAFAAIERGLTPPPHDLVLLNPLPTRSPALSAWLAHWHAAGQRCLLVEPDATGPELEVRLRASAGGLPQSVGFALDQPQDRRDLIAYLRAMRPGRVVVVAPERRPPALTALAAELALPVDLLVSGASGLAQASEVARHSPSAEAGAPRAPDDGGAVAALAERADRLLCGDGMTLALAARALPSAYRRKLVPLPTPTGSSAAAGPGPPGIRLPSRTAPPRLGVLSPLPGAEVSRLATAIAARARRDGFALQLVVIGGTLNDLGLLADAATFVTGPVPADETAAIVARYRCAALASPYRDRGFEGLERATAGGDVRRAFFDWSLGAYERRSGDLVLDPGIGDDAAAAQIVRWFLADPEPPP